MSDKNNQLPDHGLKLCLSEQALGSFLRTIVVLCILGAQFYDLPVSEPVEAAMEQSVEQMFSGE
ncbi:hypothetical protein Lepto7375DRAFT_1020 [Leptolyngbya sp. PCC 7375]|nr:hypothetical protein Lepto7375DRAFT_1020 [Leptolyngbya sp. PCC 7375]